MEKIYYNEIAKLFNNQTIENDFFISNISTDTRKDCSNSLFFALIGENFDGHNFVINAINQGAKICVVNHSFKNIINQNSSLSSFKYFLFVDDTIKALGKLANYYKKKFNILTIGITGSNGKTTTRNLLFSIFSLVKKTITSIKNFNNAIGLPLSIFNINSETEVGIFELGMNHLGEIFYLADIIELDSAIITSVFPSHLEGLGSLENVIKAKSEILQNLKEKIAFLNGDNENVLKTLNYAPSDLKIIKYGITDSYYPVEILTNKNGYYEFKFCDTIIKLNIIGEHNLLNSIGAATIAKYYGISDDVIKTALENYKSADKRSEIFERNGIIFYVDCYNSNPGSAQFALKTLNSFDVKGNIFIVFGDMLELGEFSTQLHLNMTTYLEQVKKLKFLFLVGNEIKVIYDNFKSTNVNLFLYDKSDDSIKKICEKLNNELKENDLLFIKGSRGIKLERIFDYLKF
ncbi:MAG TPA: UDP-N-acetylmuramoyl-tripeptide--D-alanyl-D-alanine ligase [bacterium]|nr:UDP-N-acetylmuramoyl-tripeptide--D-alanyl-D-alanine ligase [bacterium]HOL46570.1 UDP-N-acetylmuramoyl-tripeptide--D-alanyl-D-alanine ligase [bacterium]HPQ17859.1 UDP-N-acetylmuramoyl-tripeptide--D-alanyl-D-alanine ligase [bacterium]